MKRKSGICAWLGGVMVAASGFPATDVAAQGAPDDYQPVDIVVTAQKRAESSQDVGIAITAFSGETLANMGVTDTARLDAVTPGLIITQFGNSPNNSLVNIRGVSQNDFSDHNEAPVAIYNDGAYVSFMGAAGRPLFDVARIEVLRGPQGTLFGRNSTGGLINIVSVQPDQEGGYIRLNAGEWDDHGVEAAIGGTVAGPLKARLSGIYHKRDGFVRNRIGRDSGAIDDLAGRLQLLYDGGDVQLLLKAEVSTISNAAVGGYDIRSAFPNPDNNGLVEFVPEGQSNPFCEIFFGFPNPPGSTDCLGFTEDDNPYTGSFQVGNLDRDIYDIGGTLTWNLGNVTLTAITNYQSLRKDYIEDSDSTPLTVGHFNTTVDGKQFSQEVRLNGEVDRLRWIVGGYFLDIRGDFTTGLISDIFAAVLDNSYRLKTQSYALFGQVDYKLSDTLTLVGGLRWSWDRKTFDFNPTCTGPGCIFFEFPGTVQVTGFEGKRRENDPSFKLQLNYEPNPDTLIYAGITRGTKAGGFSAPALASFGSEDIEYDTELLTSYEIGTKLDLRSIRSRLNISAFYYDYSDYQVFKFENLAQIIFNADAEVYGGEIELVTTPMRGTDISLGASFLEGKVFDVPLPNGALANREMPNSPGFSLNGMIRQRFDLSEALGLGLQVDGTYTGSYFFRADNHPALKSESRIVMNARATLYVQDRFEFAVFGENIFDEWYRTTGYDDTQVNGVVNSTYGRPRWFGASLLARFGD